MPDGDDRLSGSLQESIITALAFGGKEAGAINSLVTLDHFEHPYREVASRVIDFRHRFGEPPGVGHLDDLFDDVLRDASNKKYATTRSILIGMHELSTRLNLPYVTTRVREFVRQQTLKQGIMDAAERYQNGGVDLIDDVERILLDTVKQQTDAIDLGTRFTDLDRVFRFLDKSDEDYFLTGIPELDKQNVVPRKGEVYLFIAPKGRGKSWLCHYLGKKALAQRWRVLHISLENYEDVVSPRYLQSFFSVAKHAGAVNYYKIGVDDTGRAAAFTVETLNPEFVMGPAIRAELTPQILKFPFIKNLIVKEFPSGFLTVQKLEAYLDYLEFAENFLPDLVLLDYPALMSLDARNFRLSLGRTLVDLRGLAKRRNFALVTPSQGNREGIKAQSTKGYHVSEDISQLFTADIVLTYSQTDEEHRLGLARLYVNNSRNDADRFTVLVSQAYQIGQFKLTSAMMHMDDDYFDMVRSEIAMLGAKNERSNESTSHAASDNPKPNQRVRQRL